NMVRQLGGSIGIAMITTFISRETVKHFSILSENITLTDPSTQQRVMMLKSAFQSKGYDPQSATQNAYAVIDRTVMGQATFLTYEDLFIGLGFFFLLMIPFLILFRNKKKKEIKKEEQMEWGME
ncbi:MAG TPA: hypothetical protein VMI12_10875, partial [Puia sp.]|nr:hypothetical protein [Puia sp.]